MENKSHAFLAGLFVLLLGAAALAALYWLGGGKDETQRDAPICHIFSNLNGVKARNYIS